VDKLLVVDDEVEILNILTKYLKDDYDILTASSGQEGIDVFERERPPVIITDMKLPGMDGIEFMRRVKLMDGDAEVIVITGHGDMEIAIESLRLGAVDFLLKPIDFDDLERAIKRALDKLQAEREMVASIDDFASDEHKEAD
jgi:DNA-binding NtrC family response regulator